jgi:hypothetical protein
MVKKGVHVRLCLAQRVLGRLGAAPGAKAPKKKRKILLLKYQTDVKESGITIFIEMLIQPTVL